MKTSKFSALAWLKGFTTTPQIADRDQLADSRLLRAIDVRIEENRTRRRRWFAGISIGSIFVLTTVGIAGAILKSNEVKGDSPVGVVCWTGQFGRSNAVVIGRDIAPVERCNSIVASHTNFNSGQLNLHACVSGSGVVHVVQIKETCQSLAMRPNSNSYPFTDIDAEQAKLMVMQILGRDECFTLQQLEASMFNGLQQIGHPEWTITRAMNVRGKMCVLAIIEPKTNAILIIPGDAT